VDNNKIVIDIKHQKLSQKVNQMLLDEQIDDIIEMVEDYCLMMAMDHQKTATKLTGIRSWSLLSDEEWLMFLEQLKQVKILGSPLIVLERYDHSQDVDELILNWGYKN